LAKDLVAFEQLFRKFRPGLVAFATSIIGRSNDAEELVHDVFIAIWNRESNDLDPNGIKSYLFTSVKNRCLNFIKKSKLDVTDINDESPVFDANVNAHTSMVAKESEKRIHLLIDQLPKKCKQVFLMSRMYELSYKEIAEILEITPKTVENQISIALKFLKENFNKN
jgi:RNA polymerase sigma-70 factor (ECF subfamily)